MRPISQPLFAFDPGWLFLLAGLVMCAAVVVLPANEDVEALELELAILQREESTVYQRLGANAAFLEAVDSRDSRLLRRLAAGQLNLVPESAVPVLMSTSASEPVRHWIEAPLLGTGSGGTEVRERSHLERWSAGDHRLWILGAGTLAIFYGLLPRLIAGRAEA